MKLSVPNFQAFLQLGLGTARHRMHYVPQPHRSGGEVFQEFLSFFGGSQVLCYHIAGATPAAPFLISTYLGAVPGLLYQLIVFTNRSLVCAPAARPSHRIMWLITRQVVLWRIVARG